MSVGGSSSALQRYPLILAENIGVKRVFSKRLLANTRGENGEETTKDPRNPFTPCPFAAWALSKPKSYMLSPKTLVVRAARRKPLPGPSPRSASEPRWASPSSCSGAPPNPLPARSPLASSPEPRSSPIPPRVPLQLALIPFPTCFHSDRIKNSIHSNQRRDEPLGVGQKRAPALLAHLDHPQQARAERPKPHARHYQTTWPCVIA